MDYTGDSCCQIDAWVDAGIIGGRWHSPHPLLQDGASHRILFPRLRWNINHPGNLGQAWAQRCGT